MMTLSRDPQPCGSCNGQEAVLDASYEIVPCSACRPTEEGLYLAQIRLESVKRAIESARASFKYKYVGGGYFRDSTVPRGEKAETLHGVEVLETFKNYILMTLLGAPDEAMLERTPYGTLNNCSMSRGGKEEDCLVCKSDCPDREKFF